MSVFKSLRGTFQSVQHDIAAGLKSITTRDSSQPAIAKLGRSQNVTLDAGADILNKYQNVWKSIHRETDDNAKRAESLDAQIGSLYVQYDRREEMVEHLHAESANLPIILNKLQELTDVLAGLETEFSKVEGALIQLENVCEEVDQAKEKESHELALNNYRQRKLAELEKTKAQLAKDHTKKLREYEKEHQQKLKDRHEVFDEAFSQDVEFFRVHGHMDKKLLQVGSEASLLSDSVEIKSDEDILEEDKAKSAVQSQNESDSIVQEGIDKDIGTSDSNPEKLLQVGSEASLLSDSVEIKSDEDILEEDKAKSAVQSQNESDSIVQEGIDKDIGTSDSNPGKNRETDKSTSEKNKCEDEISDGKNDEQVK